MVEGAAASLIAIKAKAMSRRSMTCSQGLREKFILGVRPGGTKTDTGPPASGFLVETSIACFYIE